MPTPEQLQLLFEVSRKLARFKNVDNLVSFATRRARELFDADGCAILMLTSNGNEFYFPHASQAESLAFREVSLKDIRFPSSQGIAGWVLEYDKAIIVRDAQNDPRFYNGVDKLTGLVTHSLMCAPLPSDHGNIGVIQLLNPGKDPNPPDGDLDFFEAVANDIAVALEKARLASEVNKRQEAQRPFGSRLRPRRD